MLLFMLSSQAPPFHQLLMISPPPDTSPICCDGGGYLPLEDQIYPCANKQQLSSASWLKRSHLAFPPSPARSQLRSGSAAMGVLSQQLSLLSLPILTCGHARLKLCQS